jgi:hypothetical protein
MAASSGSPVVRPSFGWMPPSPRKYRSAETAAAASAAAAPQAATECLNSRPPRMNTSTVGCSARAAAVVGLWVMTVAARSGRSARAISIAVVPLSRMTVVPDVIISAARAAMRRLLCGAISVRALRVPSAGETGSAPP